MKPLMKGSEPFFLPGNGRSPNRRVGCLVLHGFTGTPFEMRGLGERLAQEGYPVLGPRLTHHGTSAADMNRSRWWDWYYSALDGWHLLKSLCDEVVVIGLSMGGLTALMVAANNPVAGVVAMSTPAVFMDNDRQLTMARYLWWLSPLLKKPEVDESWPCYDQYPVRAAGELGRYREALEAALPAVTVPALLLHAVHDESVPVRNLDYIYGKINSAVKRKVIIERGGHVMTEDVEKERVYQEVIAFLAQIGA